MTRRKYRRIHQDMWFGSTDNRNGLDTSIIHMNTLRNRTESLEAPPDTIQCRNPNGLTLVALVQTLGGHDETLQD